MDMNYIWSGMIIISVITAFFTGHIQETVNAVFEGAATSVTTLISFAGAMCFWNGIMRIAEKSGIADTICRFISPVVRRLFPGCGDSARRHISMNITANLLGMGNAATPMGMKAAEELDQENKTPEIPSYEMCMLVVINTTSFQLLPTTILALRAAAGSEDPVSVIVPIWFASAIALTAGILSVRLLCGRRRRKVWNT